MRARAVRHDRDLDPHLQPARRRAARRHRGLALPGVGVRVVDDADLPVAAGVVGAVQVRGPNVFAGYWRRPDLRAADFTADGWFRTGDLGSLSADGYLTIVGRAKDLVISGGLNVYPKEVEAVLDELPRCASRPSSGCPTLTSARRWWLSS